MFGEKTAEIGRVLKPHLYGNNIDRRCRVDQLPSGLFNLSLKDQAFGCDTRQTPANIGQATLSHIQYRAVIFQTPMMEIVFIHQSIKGRENLYWAPLKMRFFCGSIVGDVLTGPKHSLRSRGQLSSCIAYTLRCSVRRRLTTTEKSLFLERPYCVSIYNKKYIFLSILSMYLPA